MYNVAYILVLPFKVQNIAKAEFFFNTVPRFNISFHCYQIIGRQCLGLCQKNHQKDGLFSIKICLLNHRKFDKMQEGSSEEAK